jgi:endoglucanase
MKRIVKVLLIIISLLFVKNVYATPFDNHGELNVSGTNIVDKNNKIFQIRGVSTHGIGWFPEYVNKDAFKYMRDEWGINAVRLAMYSEPSCNYNEETRNKVKQGIEYAKELGLYVIVDWHILNDNNPNIYKSEAIKFFKEIASEYHTYDNILYEICNEPNGSTEWSKDIKPYAIDVINEIRKIDDDAIIIVGTPTWSQDLNKVEKDPIKDQKNIMYTLHFYAGTHKEYLQEKYKNALKAGLPVFVTEFGAINADGNGSLDYDSANKWMNLLKENNTSFIVWQLSNKNEGASLIRSDVKKTTGWTEDELAPHGKWYLSILKSYEKEKDEVTTTTTKVDDIAPPTTTVKIVNNKRTNKKDNTIVIYTTCIIFLIAISIFVFIIISKKNRK